MKIIHIVTMAALALGLSQMAYANHDGTDGMHCNHKGMMQDADANKDGAVSRDEFTAAHQARADKMFAKMDANKDGKIDQAERDAMKANMKDRCNMKDHKMHDMNKMHEMNPDSTKK
ncbi:MAG: EF-hand domain-containing protein [Methylotenera sp.]